MWLARHRWQIPELGRWANRDPIGYAGGSQNLYEYVNGNPVFLVDPLGLSADDAPKSYEEVGWFYTIYYHRWTKTDDNGKKVKGYYRSVYYTGVFGNKYELQGEAEWIPDSNQNRDVTDVDRQIDALNRRGGEVKAKTSIGAKTTIQIGTGVAVTGSFVVMMFTPVPDESALVGGLAAKGLAKCGDEVVKVARGVVRRETPDTKILQKDWDFAEEIALGGKDVIVRGTKEGADFIIDGVHWELKTLESGSKTAVENAIRDMKAQATHGFIDARKTSLSLEQAKAALANRERYGMGNLQEIRLLLRNEDSCGCEFVWRNTD